VSWFGALDDGIVAALMELPTVTQEPADAERADGSGDRDEDLDDGVDVTLIRWMLSLSPEQRLDVLQPFLDSIAELTGEQAAG
jgi:hypothetical protein